MTQIDDSRVSDAPSEAHNLADRYGARLRLRHVPEAAQPRLRLHVAGGEDVSGEAFYLTKGDASMLREWLNEFLADEQVVVHPKTARWENEVVDTVYGLGVHSSMATRVIGLLRSWGMPSTEEPTE